MPMVAAAAAAIITSVSAVAATAVGAVAGAVFGSAAGLAIASATFYAVPGLLLSAGLSLASGLLQPHVGQTAAGTQVDWQADPSSGVPYLIGRSGTAGNIVLVDTAGDKHKYLFYSTVLSGAGPIQGVDGFYGNYVALTFSADSGEGQDGYYRNRMWWKSSLGGTPAAHLAFTATGSKDTPANHGGIPGTWGAAAKLSGLAHDILALEYDPAIYTAGVPKPLRVARGVKVYDPRKDSTYPGGSGAHRWADPANTAAHDAARATWEYSENPHLHALHWSLGRWERDTTNSSSTYVRTFGVGAPIAAVDVAAFVQGANVNDANGHKVGGVIYSTDSKWDVLTAMLQAGASRPLKLGAKISCLVQTPRVSLDTITGDDLTGDSATVAGTQPSRDRINAIWPRYREETQGWELVPTSLPVTVPAYETIDGGRRTKEVTYGLCQASTQAGVLARYDIEDARELGPITLPLKPYWMGYRPGDCLTVNEPELGLVNQKVLMIARSQDPATLAVTGTFRSETDGKHAFALGQTADPPPSPALTGIDPQPVSAPPSADWGAIGGASTSPSGQSLPAILITGSVSDANVADVIVEYRLAGGTVWADWTTLKASDAVTTTITGLAPQTAYVPRIRYRSVRGQVADDAHTLELGTVTTGGVATDWANVTDPLSKKPEDNATLGATVGTTAGATNLKTPDGTKLLQADVVTNLGTSLNTTNVGSRTAADVISDVAAAISDAAAALDEANVASAVSLVAATYNPSIINANPDFFAWTTASAAPNAWRYTGPGAGSRIGGVNGHPYAVALSTPAAPTEGTILGQDGLRMVRGWMVIEAEIRCADTTSWLGAGAGFLNTDGSVGYYLSFSQDADINGVFRSAPEYAGWSYKFSKLIQVTAEDYGAHLYGFVASGGLGISSLAATPARTIYWDHLAVRPASQAEIDGHQALPAAKAYTDASVYAESVARAGSEGALATSINTVSARVGAGGRNLVPNPSFALGAANWSFPAGVPGGSDDVNGPYVILGVPDNASAYYCLSYQDVPVQAGQTYSAQASFYSGFISSPNTYLRLIIAWLDASHAVISGSSLMVAQTNVNASWTKVTADGVNFSAPPTGAVYARVQVDIATSSGNIRSNGGNAAATKIKLERADYCSSFTDEALSASVTQTATAVALINGTQAAEYKIGVVAGYAAGEVAIGAIEKHNPDGTVSYSSAFRVKAEAVEFEGSDGSKLTFAAQGGGRLSVNNLYVGSAHIGDLTVGTSKISTNAVSSQSSAQSVATTFISSTSDLVSLGLTTQGGVVTFTVQIAALVKNNSGSSTNTFTIGLLVDGVLGPSMDVTVRGVLIAPYTDATHPGYGGSVSIPGTLDGVSSFTFQTQPPAGSHTFQVRVINNGGLTISTTRSNIAVVGNER